MEIFETHCHLDLKDYNNDRDKLIQNAFNKGVTKIINVGFNAETSNSSIQLAKKYTHIYASVGYHPHDAKSFDETILRDLITKPKVIALGEIGLDYYRDLSPRDIQRQVFAKQLQIAKENNLPVIIHDRDAHEECYQIIKNSGLKNVVFHCFSGDELFAEKVLAEGWHISFTGTVTYKNNALENVVRMVPSDKFFIETDAPYLTPVPHRGQRNNPEYLIYVIQKIADILRKPPKIIAETAYKNAENFFLKK